MNKSNVQYKNDGNDIYFQLKILAFSFLFFVSFTFAIITLSSNLSSARKIELKEKYENVKIINHFVDDDSNFWATRNLDLDGDFVISDVYQHDINQNEVHHFQLSQDLKKRKRSEPLSTAYNFTDFTTANTTEGLISRARAMAQFLQITYPYVPEYGDEYNSIYNSTQNKIKNANFTTSNIFRGSRDDMADESTIGVQVVVFTNVKLGVTALVWRGTYSNPDVVMNGIWFGDRFKYDLAENSKARWIENGQDEDVLVHNDVAEWFNRMCYDIASPGIYSSLKTQFSEISDLNGIENLNDQTYYAISKAIVKDIIPAERAANRTIYLAGHSLGGAVAGLTSLYYDKMEGQRFETHLVASYGHRCLAQNIANDETNWQSQNTFLHYWVTDFDLIPQLDNPIGQVCRLGSDDTVYDACHSAYGKGMELVVLQGTLLDDCMETTHDTWIMMDYLNNNTRIQNRNCYYVDWDQDTMCLEPSPPAAYIAFFFFFWFFGILIIVGIILGIIACCVCCWRKKTGRGGKIYPCCCFPCCYVGATASDEYTLAP